MKITTLLETNTTPSSDPAGQQSQQAPKFGRDPHVLEDEQLDEMTAGATGSGSVATGEPTNMGVQRRGKGSMLQGIKTSKKFPNSTAVKEGVEQRQQNALWAQITDYEKRAKATKNDIKKAHYMKMASELRSKLKTNDEQSLAEGPGFDKWADDRAASQLYKLNIPKTWEVSYDYGPHMTKTVKVKARSEEEASAKVEKAAEKKGLNIMINSVTPVEQGVAEGEEQGLDNKYRRTAKAMIQVYKTNPEVKDKVDASPEFFRAMVYETGVVKNPEHLDGTTHYRKLVDELESIFHYGREQGVAEGSSDRRKQEQEADKWLEKRIMKCTCPTSARNNPKCPVHGKKKGVAEASPEATFNVLKGLKSWQVVIMNNYYRGKYSDYSGRYYYVLASSPEEAKQVVLDNADAILQDLLSMKSVNGKKILPRGSAVRITADRIGEIKDGTEAGRMTTMGYKKMFSPQGPMMVKLTNGAIADVQGQEQGVTEGTAPFGNKCAGPFASEERAKREASRISKELGVKRYVEKTSDGKYIVVKKQGVAEGYIFKGGFPFDVDHMPGSVIRNRDETSDVIKTKNKDKWDDEVDRINDEVFDDMADFTTDSKGETVTGNSAVWAKWDNATQTGWINRKGNPLKPWPVKEQGVAEDSIGQEALRKDREAKAEWIKNNPLMKDKNPVQQQAAWAIYSTFHKTGTDKNKEQSVDEGYDKWGWHTSVTNGEFMPTRYGNKAYVYLHDLDNESPRGGPQLVTVNKPTVAKRIAKQFGGKVVKTDLNTYRVVKPAEQGVTEAEKYPEPEQEVIDATRRARLQREREPQGSEKIDAMLAQRNAQLQQYNETGKFWLKKKDTQEHISDAYVGKAAANQAALQLLKQHPELKGNIVITAWGPGETPVNEAELSEEQLLARDLKKQLELFKQAVDHDLGTKPNDKELGKKPKDKEVQKKK